MLISAALRDSPILALAISKFKKTGFIKSRDQLDRDYQTVAGIAGLPREEQTKRLADFEAKLQSARKREKPEDVTRHFSTQYLPNIGPPLKSKAAIQAVKAELYEKLQLGSAAK